jgi:hypothetical protein
MAKAMVANNAAGGYIPPEKINIITAPAELLAAGAKVMREAAKKEKKSQKSPETSAEISR